MYEEYLLVPEKRTRELNSCKKKIEESCKIKLDVDLDGRVTISGEDVLECDTAKRIIKAVARGFDEKDAMELLNEENSLEFVDITDYGRNTRKGRILLKSRVIGTHGKVKRTIQHMTETKICIFGKTVAIIGKIEEAFLARRAIEIILDGAKQTTAYQFIRESLEANERIKKANEESN